MVYISTPMIPTASRQSVMQAQSQLAKAQQELTSGTLADAGLTLGARSGRLVSLDGESTRLQAITDANTTASTRLSATATALDTLRTTATTFLSTLTSALSSGGSTTALASAANGNLSALSSALNSSVSGDYIFGGINTGPAPIAPYASTPPSPAKQAVDTAFQTTFGTSQKSSGATSIDAAGMQEFLDTSFAALFSNSAYTGTWSSASDQTTTSTIGPGQVVATSVSANAEPFRQLAQAYTMVTEFAGQNLSAGATTSVLRSAMALVTSAMTGLTSLQAGVGITQSAIASSNSSMAAQITLLSNESSTLNGVDPYALTTKVSSLQTQIQASYELTAKLQQMSLVNYLA